MNGKYPKSRKDNLVIQETESEVLIYDLADNKAFCLNETSAIIWQLCDGNKSLTQITNDLSDKLKSPADEALVWLALEQLKKENLIENEINVPIMFAGMSRREVIRKVGFGSMIALPIVSSLLAPTAAHATSAACRAAGPTVFNRPCTCPFTTPIGSSCPGGATCPGVDCNCIVQVNAPGINPNPGACG